MADDQPGEPPPPPPARRDPQHPPPPLLDYPSRPPQPEIETEQWSDFFRALLIVFGVIALLFFSTFGLCGVLGRGCG